ncbi:Inner membrane protein YqiK [Olavius sp. associated proteobacterium Delta 1]|nr:Inner membrane protein YqiK [Olavius sp. associated proteobacterium Delta 1]
MATVITWAIVIIIILAAIIVVLAWFYQRATREESLVKTGIGGRKVIMDGGTIAVPYFHEVSKVNMQTLRLEVQRTSEAALITRDRMRVDVGVEFYVSVVPSEDGIARAIQTLGNRTFHADQLRELIQGKLVDALRSVAARMTMDELHENRGAFVSDVREGLVDSLARNGLELDSVSLTSLDQTPFARLDENNVFNAVGMRKLAEVVAKSKKERAEIDSDAEISVRNAAMETTKRKLQISLEEQEAEISQVQEIETLKAAQLAEVAKRKAEGEREAARARILMEKEIRSTDIARETAIREAEIASDKKLQEIEILQQREIALANQESQIIIAAKSQEESKAQVIADEAKAEAVKAAEGISTARQIAEAERKKAIALVAAKQDAEASSTRQQIAAQAEKEAAVELAKAKLEQAEAKKQEMLAEAEGRRALIAAENETGKLIVEMKTDLARLEALPKIVAEMVKPAEKIDSIKIHQLSGLGSERTKEPSGSGDKPVISQVFDSILEMAVQLPALKKIGEEIGINFDDGLADVTRKVTGDEGDNKSSGVKRKKS